uniref:non-specific serine/threonine protein kinase n=2 Tax=Fagus sylvatica TaxID=28930 RepID=A0A2N9H8Q0_FAGSY
MLVYEYIPNGTLMDSLSGKSGIRLDWMGRLKATLGAARGLVYLHEHANPSIIHRDIKSNNILLDESFNAKVADFGLSKSELDSGRNSVTTQVKGTLGYLDPEYYMSQQLTKKSDVYSFGVVMLELITARRPIERGKHIVGEVRKAMDKTKDLYNLHEIIDPFIGLGKSLKGLEEFVNLAMRCVEESGDKRPTMDEVVKEIEKIMQLAGMNLSADSEPSSANYVEVSKGSSHHPYNSDAFSYSSLGQPRSAPLLLNYQPLIGNFLEGPTVPRAQEVRVEPTTLYVAHPATLATPPENLDLIPTGEVSEMAPPIDPYELMGKKSKGKGKAKQGAQAKKQRRAIYEVIALEQEPQSADSESAAREELAQPPPIVENDKPEVVSEPPPRAKRARTEGEPSYLSSPSSSDDVWALELMVGQRPITIRDIVLDTSNVEHSAKVAHALAAATCLPGDFQAWTICPQAEYSAISPAGLSWAFELTKCLKEKEAEHVKAIAVVMENATANYTSLEQEHQKAIHNMKEAEEQARTEAEQKAKMAAEVAELQEKVKLQGVFNRGFRDGWKLALKRANVPSFSEMYLRDNTPLPYPEASLKETDDEGEDEEEDDETEEAGTE